MNATKVVDTSAWLLTVPLLPTAGTLDFSTGLRRAPIAPLHSKFCGE